MSGTLPNLSDLIQFLGLFALPFLLQVSCGGLENVATARRMQWLHSPHVRWKIAAKNLGEVSQSQRVGSSRDQQGPDKWVYGLKSGFSSVLESWRVLS